MTPTEPERPSDGPTPMSDRRFLTVLVGALTAVAGIGVVALALLGLQDPVYRDFDTGTVRDTTRALLGLATVGVVLVLGGLGTAVALVRLHLHGRL